MKTIYFPQENDRTFYIPLVLLTFVEGQETQTPIEASSLTEVKFQYGQGSRLQEREHRVNDNYIIVEFPAGTLKTNEKVDFHLTGKRDGVKFAKHIYEAACPVPFDHMANEKDFILGQPTILPTQILISANEMTDEELEQLKEQYREKVEDLEEKIDEYEEKIHTIEGVAQEETLKDKSEKILTAIGKAGGNPSKQAFESMKRYHQHLYNIEYGEIDYEAARDYFRTHFANIGGACTALRKGQFYGRNFDWYYDKEVEFLVRIKAHNGRYASIGIAGSIAALTTDTIGEYSEEFKWLPFRLLDGLNEKGLACNVNMLNHDETRSLPETGTTPLIEERERICSAMLCRYILDNFATPKEACEYIRDYVAVYPPKSNGETKDLHFALCNKEQTYYLCFEPNNSNQFETMIQDASEFPFIMTNFRLWWAHQDMTQDGHFDRTSQKTRGNGQLYIEEYGAGIERANLCLDFINSTEERSVLDFITKDLRFTKAYEQGTDPQWLTEFVGNGSYGDLKRFSPEGDFDTIVAAAQVAYENRDRNNPETWQTVHSIVYDLQNLTLQLITQEGEEETVISLDCFKSLPSSKEDIHSLNPAHPADIATLEEHIRLAIGALQTVLQGTNAGATLTAILAAFGTIDFSTLAKQGTNPDATNTAILAAFGNIDFSSLAKQGTNDQATNTAILAAINNIDFSALAKQGPNAQATLSEVLAKLDACLEATANPTATDTEFEAFLEYFTNKYLQ